jgi:hypothetical protein
MRRKNNQPTPLMDRLKAQILTLGGEIPAPWPWAITGRKVSRGKVEVDVALYNLQLLELRDDLLKKAA